MTINVSELKAARAAKLDELKGLTGDATAFDRVEAEIKSLDGQIDRSVKANEMLARAAQPVGETKKIPGSVKSDPYEKDQSLIVGGLLSLCARTKGSVELAYALAERTYGESHPVTKAMGETKALNTGTGGAGGFVIPPDFVDLIIPLLYARSVVRKAGTQVLPMPNGTMTIPKMLSGSSATWMSEGAQIAASQPSFGQVNATAHKLGALVPVSNDMMRYATSQFDAALRMDLVKQIALAEDIAFIRGTGLSNTPKGMKTFALSGETLSSTDAYTNATVNNELAGLINKLESANVDLDNVGWIMHPRTKNALYSLQNSLGLYVYRDEMEDGKLFGYPFYTTTQIPTNLSNGTHSDCSELYLVAFAECLILEARQLEFAISQEGVYTDGNGVVQSAFQNDLTLVRGILAEDFQMRHNEGVAFDSGVRWSPAVS